MSQPVPTSPLDSRYTPSDEVRFGYEKTTEHLTTFEQPSNDTEIAEALKRALAAAGAERISETAVNTLESVKNNNTYEMPRISIPELQKAGAMIRYAREYELTA